MWSNFLSVDFENLMMISMYALAYCYFTDGRRTSIAVGYVAEAFFNLNGTIQKQNSLCCVTKAIISTSFSFISILIYPELTSKPGKICVLPSDAIHASILGVKYLSLAVVLFNRW